MDSREVAALDRDMATFHRTLRDSDLRPVIVLAVRHVGGPETPAFEIDMLTRHPMAKSEVLSILQQAVDSVAERSEADATLFAVR